MSFLGRSSPPANPPGAPQEDYGLATPEEIAQRKRRRSRLVWGTTAVLLLVLGGFAARPALHAVKGWQARRAAAEALRLLDAGKPDEAVTKVQDAVSLRGNDPEVIRAAAVFLTRVGHGREALPFWRELEKQRTLTVDEQRNYAADHLLTGDPAEAAKHLHLAWPEGQEGTPADWYLGMQIAIRGRDVPSAVMFAKRLLNETGKSVAGRERLDAALTLLGVNEAKLHEEGEAALRGIADGGQSLESLQAVLILLKQASQPIALAREQQKPVPDAAVRDLLDLAARVEKHPQAKTAQQLAAVQARLVAQPDQRAALLQQAVERFENSNVNDDLAALGAWLYAQGEFQRVLEIISPERSVRSRALYLQYLDTLGALGRWEEIRHAVEGQRFTLEPMTEQMYLARCAAQVHQPESSVLHWNAALQAAGTNLDKLLGLGHYAQGNGAVATAEAAFRAAVKVAPENRPAREALLGVLEAQGRTRDTREAIAGMLAVWPQDSAVRNDYAYLGALLKEDLKADRDTAHELLQAEPGSLPHRVALALAELRLGHDLTALETLRVVDVGAYGGQPRFLAVYAATLWETGFQAEARTMVAGIPRDALLPEERELLDRVKDPDGPAPNG